MVCRLVLSIDRLLAIHGSESRGQLQIGPRTTWHAALGSLLRLLSISPHEFCPRENMTLHQLGELIVSCSRRKPEFGVQSKQPSIVAMRAGWRTWPHIADLAAVISALSAGARNFFALGNIGINSALFCGNVVENPVREAARSGRIRHEESMQRIWFHPELPSKKIPEKHYHLHK